MSYVQYAQKQYTLDLLRQPTVIIFSPKVIKKAALYESYEQLRKEDFQLQLVNTRLVKQLIKNSCFMFLKPILTGPIMIAYSPKKVDISTLLTIAQKVSDKLSFTASLLDGKLFLTKNRLDLVSINPYHQLYSVFILYFLYNIKCLEHKMSKMLILWRDILNEFLLQTKERIAVDKCPQRRVTCLQVNVITNKCEFMQRLFLIITTIVVYLGKVTQFLPVYVLQDAFDFSIIRNNSYNSCWSKDHI